MEALQVLPVAIGCFPNRVSDALLFDGIIDSQSSETDEWNWKARKKSLLKKKMVLDSHCYF